MAENLGRWLSGRGPIFKIRPSDGCGRNAVPLAVGQWYNFHSVGCHLGNVGLMLGPGENLARHSKRRISSSTRKAASMTT